MRQCNFLFFLGNRNFTGPCRDCVLLLIRVSGMGEDGLTATDMAVSPSSLYLAD